MNRGRIAPLPALEGDGRTVEVRLVAWNTPARVSDDGRTWYREAFTRGGLTPAAGRLLVRHEHNGPVVGRIDTTEDREDGLYGVLRIADTTAGRDALALARERVLDAVSVEFEEPGAARPREGELVTRSRSVLTGVALTLAPLHDSAAVLAVRSDPTTTEEDPVPTEDPTTTEEDPVPTTDDPTTDPAEELEDEPAALVRSAPVPRPAARVTHEPSPAQRFRSVGEWWAATLTGELPEAEGRRYLRSWTDQLVADVPGLMPAAWLTRVVDIVAATTPTIQAFSRDTLPAEGETVNLPVVTGHAPVAKQATGKTEIASGKLTVATKPFPVEVYAGGQDVDVRVLRRSTPAYLTVLMNAYATELANALEVAAASAVLAASDDTHTTAAEVDPADPTKAFITAAAGLYGSVGRWPEVAVLGLGLWQALAEQTDADGRPIFPEVSPTNPAGRVSITDGTGNVRGLTFYVSSAMGTTGVVGVREAFTTMVGTVQTLGVDVPKLLGRDVAVYQEAAMGATDTRGLYKLTLKAAAPLSGKAKA